MQDLLSGSSGHGAEGTVSTRISTDNLRRSLAIVATNTLGPVARFLTWFYAIFALAHSFLVPAPQKAWMVASAVATALFLAVFQYTVRQGLVSMRHVHALEGMVAGLLIWNALFHLYLMRDPRQTTNVLLILAGCGFLFVSRGWLAATATLTIAGWAACMFLIGAPTADWLHYGIAVIEAACVGIVVHVVTIRRLQHLQLSEAARKQRLEQTSEELKRLALVDALTEINNRRSLMNLGEHRLRLSQRTGQALTLLFVDIDDMKRINDTWGHQEGDRALTDAAKIMTSTFRDSDIVARIGGDEFCALVEGSSEENGPEKRLQAALDASNAQRHRAYRLSWSVGSTPFDPGNPCSMEELIERADRSMYEQKRRRPA